MEYSVLDLIKSLLKKWFLILLVMCITAAAAVGLSQLSYQKAVEQYEDYTNETVPMPEGYGTATALIRCSISENSVNVLKSVIRSLPFEGGTPRFSDEELAEVVLNTVEDQISALLSNPELTNNIQTALSLLNEQTEVVVSEHMWVQSEKNYSFRLHVSGLDESTARQILDLYKAEFTKLADGMLLDMELTEESYGFTLGEGVPTDKAEFSQLVMQEPVEEPNVIRNAITGAVFGFALACILILLLTFAKDSAAQAKGERK